MSEICEEYLRIGSDEVNMYRVLRTSTLFEHLQRISIRQMEEYGIGRDRTLDRGLLWVILRQWAVVERMPEYDEQVTLRSWPGKMMHVIFPRHYEMVSGSGDVLLRAQALWMLIDQNSRHHIFPDEYGIEVRGVRTGRELPQMPAIVIPGVSEKNKRMTGETGEQRKKTKLSGDEQDGTQSEKKTVLAGNEESPKEFDVAVPYSMVDLNGHMNNTRYFDLAEDFSARAQSGALLKEVQVEYLSEAKYGSTLHVEMETGKQADYFTARIGEKNCFRMKFLYS